MKKRILSLFLALTLCLTLLPTSAFAEGYFIPLQTSKDVYIHYYSTPIMSLNHLFSQMGLPATGFMTTAAVL